MIYWHAQALIPGRPVFTAGESSCVHSQEDKATFLPPAPCQRAARSGWWEMGQSLLCAGGAPSAGPWALPALEGHAQRWRLLSYCWGLASEPEVMPSEAGKTWVWVAPCSLAASCIWLRRRKEKFYVVFRPTGKATVQLFICFLVIIFLSSYFPDYKNDICWTKSGQNREENKKTCNTHPEDCIMLLVIYFF